MAYETRNRQIPTSTPRQALTCCISVSCKNLNKGKANVALHSEGVGSLHLQVAGVDFAIARAIGFVIEQSADVDVGDIVVRPTAQE